MKWTYSIKQKITTAFLLATVLGLVMLNNLNQTRQFEKIVNSFSSLYEDRLIVESYIYKISELLHQKSHLIETSSKGPAYKDAFQQVVLQSDETILNLMEQYKKTKFTVNETKQFDSLLSGIGKLVQVEKAYIASEQDSENNLSLKDSIKTLVGINLQYLSALSDIQVAEGKQMNKASKAALMSHVASSQFETTLLIIIAIIIQILVFASNSMRSLLKQKPGLN
jgi:hypothetical protein